MIVLWFDNRSLLQQHSFGLCLMQGIQKEREDKLVQNLLQRIETYVSGDKLEFVERATKERERLKDNCKFKSWC